MAEIVKLIPNKKAPQVTLRRGQALPFQLLFFTGVRYERNCAITAPITEGKRSSRIKLDKVLTA